MLSNRYGKFSISIDLIENSPDKIREIMGKVIVLRAENNFMRKCIDYEAWGYEFDELEDTELIPEYVIDQMQIMGHIIQIFKRRDMVELSKACVETGSESRIRNGSKDRSKFRSLCR